MLSGILGLIPVFLSLVLSIATIALGWMRIGPVSRRAGTMTMAAGGLLLFGNLLSVASWVGTPIIQRSMDIEEMLLLTAAIRSFGGFVSIGGVGLLLGGQVVLAEEARRVPPEGY